MKILIAGEGGQGIQVIAQILSKAVFYNNEGALYIPNFGVEQRGGVSLAFIVTDQKTPVYPKFEKADILAVLSSRSLTRIENFRDKKTIVIRGPAVNGGLKTGLPPKVWNIFVLGQINKIGKAVPKDILIKAMSERFEQQYCKRPELRKLNLMALNI